MNILALDLSLTATGVALADGTTKTWSPKLKGAARLKWFRQQVDDILQNQEHGPVDVVVLEDYAYHGKFAHSHELGELGGVVRLVLHDHGVAWTAIIPSSLKKYATGKGNAKKPEMLASAIRRLGYEGHDDNEADALWLRAMALDHYGAPVADVPAVHREALVKVVWPDLEVAA